MQTTVSRGGNGSDFSMQRINIGPATPSAQAAAFVAALPTGLVPAHLAADFAHVLNKIAELWKQPRRIDAYFDELLIDNRGGRAGFPLLVALEIVSLKEHHQLMYPVRTSIWEAIHRADLT